ncbi:hypothetical protein BH24ACT3_BH24ACT3_03180 [soil metagenome]
MTEPAPAPAPGPGADAYTHPAGWTYHWGARKRPFVHPVTTPAGHVLTRNAPDDHPWHHALWFTIKFVNEENFWEEMAPYGVLRHTAPPVVTEAEGHTTVAGPLAWTRPDRETVIIDEERTLSHCPLDDDAYALDLRTVLTPRADVRLDRTPYTTWGGYGGLSLRGRADWIDTTLRIAGGVSTDKLRGERASWCDLTGRPDGASTAAGIAMLDHPSNPRHPVPWYGTTRAPNYGDEGWSNFLNAAFLWEEGLDLAAGDALGFTYRVIVHDGHWDDARFDAAQGDFAAEA